MTEKTCVPASSAAPSQTGAGRRRARIAAVQALYQIDIATAPASLVVPEFMAHRLEADTDQAFFAELVKGTMADKADIDALIDGALMAGWSVARLEIILKEILRAGAFELWRRADVPMAVVVNEYVDITHAFFDGSQPGMVNGILDRLGRQLRPGEGSSSGGG